MQVKVTEEFFKKRSYTHRYDHLAKVKWEVDYYNDYEYVIRYQDIKETVTEEEIVRVS